MPKAMEIGIPSSREEDPRPASSIDIFVVLEAQNLQRLNPVSRVEPDRAHRGVIAGANSARHVQVREAKLCRLLGHVTHVAKTAMEIGPDTPNRNSLENSQRVKPPMGIEHLAESNGIG